VPPTSFVPASAGVPGKMQRKHTMPFGAESRGDGTVRFRLWAPGTRSVTLEFSDPERQAAMPHLDGGWFELVTEARAGAGYRFRIDRKHLVPDPASRFQPRGVDGESEVIEPAGFDWQDRLWRGRSWKEAILYELHVGTFTPEGTYRGAELKLDYLADLGVTAIELMPVSSFPGRRNWGYDGVLPFAPAPPYGRPEDLKHFIQAAHSRNLMVFLDVVHNHFGPEGNNLDLYAPRFFSDRHRTPWGRAINFDGPGSRTVRDFFIHNALYWLEEYHFDGLRFDAVHAIADDSQPDILTELAERVRGEWREEREIHLVLENDRNAAHYLGRNGRGRPLWYTAQWNDDFHHALHVLITGETCGYYADYAREPAWHLARSLAEGFSYQGETSAFRDGEKRGEASRELPPDSFVSFIQNHDQIGNRAFGERIVELADAEAVELAIEILLLAPSPPLLFMGEEFGAITPFLFFCDFAPQLAAKVREGRRAEFARFPQFSLPEAQAKTPDPNSEQTFLDSRLDWSSIERDPHRRWLSLYQRLLSLRREKIVPLIKDIQPGGASFELLGPSGIRVQWPLVGRGSLVLMANFGQSPLELTKKPDGELISATVRTLDPASKEIAPLSAAWFLSA
jgi:maltooligosyltrehalose trehalohydrolase